MKRFFHVVVLALVFSTMFCITGVYAANPVAVVIDGTTINYQLVAPTIINDRTMVPIRETAEYLGMETEWNETNSTMYFRKDDKEIRHKLYDNVIYVNDVASSFDTPSTVIDDRTLMPVRMLAEAIEATVVWDASTYTVKIQTEQPEIITITSSNSDVSAGAEVTLKVITNENTSRVRVTDSTGNEMANRTAYTDYGTCYIFDVTFALPESAENLQTFYVYAGNGTSFNSAAGKSFTITTAEQQISIKSFNVSDSSVDYNDTITIEVYTHGGATSVWVVDPSDSIKDKTTSYSDEGSKGYLWELSFKARETGTYYIYASDNEGNEYYDKTTITVSDDSDEDYEITDYTFNDIEFDYGDTVKVTVYTGTGAEEVWMENSSGTEQDSTTSYTETNDDEYKWTLAFTAKKSGTYYVYSTNNDGEEDYISEYIDVDSSSSSSDEYSIEDYYIDDDEVYYGDTVYITVYTGAGADHVWVEDPDGSEVDGTYSYDEDDDYYVWELEFDAYEEGYYRVYSENDDGDEDYCKIYVYVEED